MKRTSFVLGSALILLCNAVMLLRTSLSRHAAPIRTVTLTERELPIRPQEEWDDSSVSLHLSWNRPVSGEAWQGSKEPILDIAKLRQLGLDCPVFADMTMAHQPPPVVAFSAFEFGENSGTASTPLRLVDASKNLEEIRNRYPDPRKHLIARAVIEARLEGFWDPLSHKWKPDHWTGRLVDVLPSDIHIPLPQARAFRSLPPRTAESPRYSVTLHYSRNLEPWVAAVQ